MPPTNERRKISGNADAIRYAFVHPRAWADLSEARSLRAAAAALRHGGDPHSAWLSEAVRLVRRPRPRGLREDVRRPGLQARPVVGGAGRTDRGARRAPARDRPVHAAG